MHPTQIIKLNKKALKVEVNGEYDYCEYFGEKCLKSESDNIYIRMTISNKMQRHCHLKVFQ